MRSTPLPKPTQYRLAVCLLLLTALLLASAGVFPASAQQPDSAEVDTIDRERSAQVAASAERKSPGQAVLYSAGGTALTFVSGIGIVVGPALGHFYADDHSQAWRGIALRSGGILLAGSLGLAGLATANEAVLTGAGLAFLGVLGHALYDIVTAWHSAKDFNESHDVNATLAPTAGPQGEQVGLSLRLSF